MTPGQRTAASQGADGLNLRGLERLLRREQKRRPAFSRFWISDYLPRGSTCICEYRVEEAEVRILHSEEEMRTYYVLKPWEHSLPPDLFGLVGSVIDHISSHPPARLDLSQEELREEMLETSRNELLRLARNTGIRIAREGNGSRDIIDRISACVVRNTVGLGLFEILLADEHVEDIYVDAPASRNPIHLTLNGIGGKPTMMRATTNVLASLEEINGLVSRIRYYSGRPFSEAFPILEADLGELNARATVIGPPLSQEGVALALRRHSDIPWTLPRLASNGTIDPFAAGLISFLIDGHSTILICGARGAGKSALLSAAMFEFPVAHRILAIEDTPELPIQRMQSLGYNVQSLVVQPSMGEDRESKSEEALRVSLRLGESAIVVGEVRGREARVLYDSMRTGKAGSSVLGTIHGDSPESVLDRVVHEMGIPKRAFLATDIIINIGLHRPRGSQTPERRLLQIVESPEDEEGGFRALMDFDYGAGLLTERMTSPSRIISRIAGTWNMDYLEALQNIQARVEMRSLLIQAAHRSGNEYLGPEWVCRANAFFWQRVEKGKGYGDIVGEFRRLVS